MLVPHLHVFYNVICDLDRVLDQLDRPVAATELVPTLMAVMGIKSPAQTQAKVGEKRLAISHKYAPTDQPHP